MSSSALDFDFGAHGGLTSSILGTNSSTSNRMLDLGGALSVVQPIYRVVGLGVQTDYRLYFQASSAVLDKGGNRSGYRWNPLAPLVDLSVGDFRFRFAYQLWGDYVLTYATSSGDQLSYTHVSGFRGEGHFCLIRGAGRFYHIPGICIIYGGVYYDHLSFTTEIQGATSRTLPSNLILWSSGMVIGVGF